MQEKKQVSIQVKVNKQIADQLKVIAREKQLRFSSYVKRILVNEVEKQKDEVKK